MCCAVAVRETFVPELGGEAALHRGLLEVFSAETSVCRTLTLTHGAVPRIDGANRGVALQALDVTNVRKLRVLPYHTVRSGSFEKVAYRLKSRVLFNLDFLRTKLRAVGLKEVVEDFTSLERTDVELTTVSDVLQSLWKHKTHEQRVASLCLTLVENLEQLSEKHHGLKTLVSQAKLALIKSK